MKDPRFYIIMDGYEFHEWSKADRKLKDSIETTARDNRIRMSYEFNDDIMTFKGEFMNLHWFIKDLSYTYDIIVS